MKYVYILLKLTAKIIFPIVLMPAASLHCFAQDASYLDGMPKSNTALQSIRGINKADTYIKQEAAYEMLQEMVAIMSGKLQGRQITFDEDLLMRHYGFEAEKLRKQYQAERNAQRSVVKSN